MKISQLLMDVVKKANISLHRQKRIRELENKLIKLNNLQMPFKAQIEK